MKCICPMGGDRACPDDCPVAKWETLSTADRKAQRQTIAKAMHKRGMTPERIAKEQNVGIATVYRDLDISHDDKCRNDRGADTLGRKKSPGRPKGKTSGKRENKRGKETPQLDKAFAVVQEKFAANEPINPHKLEKEHDFSHVTIDSAIYAAVKVRDAKPEIDAKSLSMTAQEKLAAAMRQEANKLAQQFEQHVREAIRSRLEATILPHYKKTEAEYQRIIKARKGIMDRATFNLIRSCLHPDSRASVSDKKLYDAFHAFALLEKRLLDERASPSDMLDMPSTYDELMAMKAKATAERKAKRAAHSVVRR